jgi:ribonuclease HII
MRPDFSLEEQFVGLIAGVDEAGCGPWAGPVVAAAVIFLPESRDLTWLREIHDSKKLSPRQRTAVFAKLMETPSVLAGTGQASVAEIDTMNIGQATRLAMQRAMTALTTAPTCALVDGIRKPDFKCPTHMVVKGDQRSLSIAAASIVAKVTRDQMMQQLGAEFPVYGWQRNAGYGTAQHQAALTQHGITIHHRRSFAPIARLVGCSN